MKITELCIIEQKQPVNGLPFDTLANWDSQNRGLTNIFQQFYVQKDGIFAFCKLDFSTDTYVIDHASVSNLN